ncbi:hypothetical protein MY11210_002867 [Beauveria gryllotalpidicola]
MNVAQAPSLSTTCKTSEAWDNLPVHDASTETELLVELDHMISLFDSYIGHNDVGFRAWVRRHQRAMDLGLVDTPTWPKLYRLKGGKHKWRDEVWISRYSFLVHQRDIIVKSRLQRMTCCELADKKCFFGFSWAYPRQTVRTVKSTHPARLRNRWYEPVDNCLARMAAESYGRLDFYALHAEFWGTGSPADRAVMTGDCKMKCESLEEVDVKQMECIGNGV